MTAPEATEATTNATTYMDSVQVDPSVRLTGSGFESAGTVAESTLPQSAEGSFTIAAEGGAGSPEILLQPLGLDSSAQAPSTPAGDSIVYPNVSEATDLVLRPVAAGLETFTQLRGPTASRRSRWSVTVPGLDTASLEQLGPRRVAVVVPEEPEPEDVPLAVASEDSGAATFDGSSGEGETEPGTPNVDEDPVGSEENELPTGIEAVPHATAQLIQAQDLLDNAESETTGDVLAVIDAPYALDAADRDPAQPVGRRKRDRNEHRTAVGCCVPSSR